MELQTIDPELAPYIPDEIPTDWNETDQRPRDVYRETGDGQIFKGVITKVLASVARNKKTPNLSTNNLQLDLCIRAVDAAGKVSGPEARFWVEIPAPNPAVGGHKPYQDSKQYDMIYDKARSFVRALEGNEALPAFPKAKEGAVGVYVDPSTGEELDLVAKRKLADGINEMAKRKLVDWYNQVRKGQSIILGAEVFFGVKKKKSGYNNINYVRNDDGGKEVITENFLLAA